MKFLLRQIGLWGVVLGWTALTISPVRALTPREELLRLVPGDVGFCLVIQDLRGHSQAFLESPFVRQFRATPMAQALGKAGETQKLTEADHVLQQLLGIDFIRLRDDILGDAIVLAYRPGPTGHDDQEQDLILLRARDPQLLAGLIDRLNTAQKGSGEVLAVEARKHQGVEYYRRQERSKGDHFYYLRGPVLAVSSKEGMVQRVIDLDQAGANQPMVARQLERLGAGQALAALWVNPRAFDAEIERKAAAARGTEAAVRRAVLTYWKALDGIGLWGTLGKTDFELELGFLARAQEMPEPGRKLFAGPGKAAQLWQRIPSNAMVAIAGRFDPAETTEFISTFLTPEARQAMREAAERGPGAVLGKDLFNEILPNLGPDWGFWVTAPPANEAAWVPQGTLAVRVRPGKGQPPVDRTLLSGLNTLAVLAVLSYNGSHSDRMSLQTTEQDKVEIQYLTGPKQFPLGLQPAFASKEGYLLLASSPEAVRRFRAPQPTATDAASPAEVPLLRISYTEIGRYLKTRREALAAAAAEFNPITKEEARRRLDELAAHLQLFDRLELNQRSDPGRLRLVLRLRVAEPLRK
jgi:hypothetical protein